MSDDLVPPAANPLEQKCPVCSVEITSFDLRITYTFRYGHRVLTNQTMYFAPCGHAHEMMTLVRYSTYTELSCLHSTHGDLVWDKNVILNGETPAHGD